MFRPVLIGVLVVVLAGGGYMLRSQHKQIKSLEDDVLQAQADIDRLQTAVDDLETQIYAIQSAYQVREQKRSEADAKALERMYNLDRVDPSWSDTQLPADIGGMFGGSKSAGGGDDNTSGGTVSGD